METGYNPYAAGKKGYQHGAPNVGKTKNPGGYARRDNMARMAAINRAKMMPQSSNKGRNEENQGMRNAILRKLKARQKGKPFSDDAKRTTMNVFGGGS